MNTKNTINPTSLYWALFNRFEMRLPGEAVIDLSQSGDRMEDAIYWGPKIREQVEADNFPNKPTPEKIRQELAEHGAWYEAELADDEANWLRLIWIAGCNIAEDDEPDCSDPLPTIKVAA
jgi:hypothetical protein